MPENAAVDAYAFGIGEKVIEGVVKKNEEARKEHRKAKTEGGKAGRIKIERSPPWLRAGIHFLESFEMRVCSLRRPQWRKKADPLD